MKLIFLFGVMFVISFQPVFMVSVLIIITFMYSLYMYKEIGSYWFSYVLLMVMLSGVLVVFTYMITLIPNESFEIYNLIMMFMFTLFFMISYKYEFFNDMSILTLNLWTSYIGMFNLFLVSFLLLVMLLVVIFSNMNMGCVRIK